MLIVFIGIVFTFFIISYVDRKDFASPNFLLATSFLLAAITFIWNIDNWEIYIYSKTILYVVTAMVSFSAAMMFVRAFSNHKVLVDNSELLIKKLEGREFFMLAFISVVCTAIYIRGKFHGLGSLLDMSQLLSTVYAEATSTHEGNVLLTQMKEIPTAIAYVAAFFIFFANDKHVRMKKNWLALAILSFIILAVLTTDRNILLRYIIYVVCLWILFYNNRIGTAKRKKNKVIIKRVLLILMIVSVIFYGLGKAKRYSSNFERMVSIYAGSGLYNFNLTINNEAPLRYGARTFNSLTKTVNALMGNRSNEVGHGTFIGYRSSNGYIYTSNIYSALKPYKDDFGYFGVILFPFIWGGFFELLFHMTKRRTYGFTWIFYAMSVYSILYFSVQEQFFGRLHLGRVYEIFWVVFFYFMVLKVRIRLGSSLGGRQAAPYYGENMK